MALKRSRWQEGTVVILEHVSRLLQDNSLGDPHIRKLAVWLPPQYDQGRAAGSGKRFPMLMDMSGYTSSGLSHIAWKNFSENLPERAARLIHERKMAPAIIVFPDCFTALGGNQYINSTAIGPYADYLIKEIIPFVDREFRTLATREHRGCFGKSSGGYGAMIHGMKYASTWGAIANHSGDTYFDFIYWHDWPNTLKELARYRPVPLRDGHVNVHKLEQGAATGMDDGRVKRFLTRMWGNARPTAAEVHTLMNLCMAASYDPDPAAPNGFRLPFNLDTGECITSRWKKWQKNDPINLVSKYQKNLRSLRGIYIDCGWRDQYHIHYGTRILSKRMQIAGIEHTYEEFDGTHSEIDHRLDRSLPFLTRALK
jgi:S-formylglutathione hydrolase FrmB